MQDAPQNVSVPQGTSREELFEQVAGAFTAAGMPVDASLRTFMQPLIDSTMSYEEHRALLEAMLKELGA